jgi:hypothetical protein
MRYAMKSKNLVKKIEFWTLIAVILAGVFNYFFVTRFAAREYEANAKLAETQINRLKSSAQKLQDELTNVAKQAEISLAEANKKLIEKNVERLDSSVTRLSDELANTEKRVRISLDIATFVKDIQPNLQIDLSNQTSLNENELIFSFDIKNLGAHVATIEEPPLYLSIQPIYSNSKIENLSFSRGDYELQNIRIGHVPAGQHVKHVFLVKFKKELYIPNTIYYYTEFQTNTDWSITRLAKRLLTDYMTNDEIDKLARRSYSRWGFLTLRPEKR